MLLNTIKKYVTTDFLKTSQRVARVHGHYPLGLVKIYKDDTRPSGWRPTSLGSRKDGEGCYGKDEMGTLYDDIVASGKEEGVIGVIYSLPYQNLEDDEGSKQGNTLVLGVHVVEGGVSHSDILAVFYKTSKLDGSESSESYTENVKEEYAKEYLAGEDYEVGDVASELLARKQFEETSWEGLKPNYSEVKTCGIWGDVLISEPVFPSPF